MDGFKFWFKDENLVTVWSAPNYCYRCGNVASIMAVNEQIEHNFEIFHTVMERTRVVDYRNVVPYFL